MGRATIPRAGADQRPPGHSRKHLSVDPVGTALVTLRMARQNLAALAAHPQNDDCAFLLLFNTRKNLSFLIEAVTGERHSAARELSAFFEQISTRIALKFCENGRDFAPEDRALAEVEALIASVCP